MIDILSLESGKDMVVSDQVVMKASNIISVQIGELSYAPEFGIDKNYFLQEGITFQNESFQSYVVERLSQSQISVSRVLSIIEELSQTFSYSVGESNQDNNNNKGLIL